MNSFFLKKGSRVFLSKIGHRGFFYPDTKEVCILYSSNCDILSWVGGSSKKAVLVSENMVSIAGSPNRKIPVWVRNEK